MKFIAFYLPQFHPIPENDEWWGKGFTDWRNVVKARPRFRGHYQPQIPADLGFYDLRCAETQEAQSRMALQYGIDAFCYYHYWFNGKQLLETPLMKMLENPNIKSEFCLCWANENWTRAWDGQNKQVLMGQDYSTKDSLDHINYLIPIFRDSRYIKINNRPLVLIYRTDIIPDVSQFINKWRSVAKDFGFDDLYIGAVRSNSNFVQEKEGELIKLGFDAIIEFQPYRKDYPKQPFVKRAYNALKRRYNAFIETGNLESLPLINCNNLVNYKKLSENAMARVQPSDYRKHPCVTPSWDSSARKRDATIIQNNRPELFLQWLKNAVQKASSNPKEEQLVFINAWNEWAEGCHLEPDLKNGTAFLEQIHMGKQLSETT